MRSNTASRTLLARLATLALGFAVAGCAIAGCGDSAPDDSQRADADTSAPLDAAADATADTGTDTAADSATSADASSDPDASGPAGIDPSRDGNAVAYARVRVQIGDREIPVGVWAPTSERGGVTVGLDGLVEPERAEQMRELLAAAPDGCPTDEITVVPDGAVANGSWPLVVYSHCHECLGVSGATTARRLASWGHIVLTPDHVDNTLWDALAGDGVAIGGEFLEVRGADVVGLIDAMETREGPLARFSERWDTGPVGVVGHSFGSVTAGWVAQRDERVGAAVFVAAPVENPLIPGVSAASIEVPSVSIVAVEDNSISEFGNSIFRQNFEAFAGPAIKVELADAGHWSVSDLCGLVDAFMPGCGSGRRQTDGSAFDYLDPDRGRDEAAAWATAQMAVELWGDDEARGWLESRTGENVERRNER